MGRMCTPVYDGKSSTSGYRNSKFTGEIFGFPPDTTGLLERKRWLEALPNYVNPAKITCSVGICEKHWNIFQNVQIAVRRVTEILHIAYGLQSNLGPTSPFTNMKGTILNLIKKLVILHYFNVLCSMYFVFITMFFNYLTEYAKVCIYAQRLMGAYIRVDSIIKNSTGITFHGNKFSRLPHNVKVYSHKNLQNLSGKAE